MASRWFRMPLGARSSHNLARGPRSCRTLALLHLEPLEQRLAPTVYNWARTGAGPFDWNDASNWLVGGQHTNSFPNAAGDEADLTSTLVANQTVHLNVPITLGTLLVGAAGTSNPHAFTLSGGSAGKLLLAQAATVSKTDGGADTFACEIDLTGSARISAATGTALTVSGPITGSAILTKAGPGDVVLSAANSYTGGTVIRAGTLRVGDPLALGLGTVTLNDANTGKSNTALLTSLSGSSIANNIVVANRGTGTTTIGSDGGGSAEGFSGSLTLNRATTLQGQSADSTTFSGLITGNVGTLTITSGCAILTNPANNFNGSINLTGQGTVLRPTNVTGDTGFSDSGPWTANGAATLNQDVVTLTHNVGNEAGSAFWNTPVLPTASFVASFRYFANGDFAHNNAADGIAFVLQDVGPSALGQTGGNLGYVGMGGNSLAVALNLWPFAAGGPGSRLYINGVPQTNYQSVSPVNLDDSNGKEVTLYYNAASQTLTESILEENVTSIYATSYAVTLASIFPAGDTVYVGLTGGDGSATATQQVALFRFQQDSGSPIPSTTNVNVDTGSALQVAGAFQGLGALTGNGAVVGLYPQRTVLTIGTNGASGTFSGQIRDNGTSLLLIKAGSGTETLSSDNSYSGGTTISGGTLQLGNPDALGLGTVTLNDGNTGSNNTALLTDLAGSTIANNIVVATGGTGTTTIGSDGGGSAEAFSGSLTLSRATTLQGQNADSTTYTGNITGNVGMLTISSGRTTLTGNDNFTGAVDITSGSTLQVNATVLSAANDIADDGILRLVPGQNAPPVAIGALSGGGAVNADTGGGNYLSTLSLGGDNASSIFTGVLSNGPPTDTGDTLKLIKAGSGTETFAGTSTYTGGTFVNAGTLLVNGSTNGAVTVAAGAVLGGGAGTAAGNVSGVAVSGTLAPGAGPGASGTGILSAGSVSFASSSAFAVTLNGTVAGTAYDQLQVTGNLALSNTPILSVAVGYNPVNGDVYTIVTATGTISGKFAGLPDGATYLSAGIHSLKIHYTTHAITLTEMGPTVQISAPAVGVTYQPLTFTLSVTDPVPSLQTNFMTYTVNWGDNSSSTLIGLTPLLATHAYATAGTFTISVTVTDAGDNNSLPATKPVIVHATPQFESGVLALPGTATVAIYRLTPVLPTGATAYRVRVRRTSGQTTTDFGTFAVPGGQINVYGGPSTDAVRLDGTSLNDAFTQGFGTVSEQIAQGTAHATTFTIGLSSVTGLTLAGNGGSDSLTGPNGNNSWDLTSANSGTVNSTTSFTGIGQLIGGSGTDVFYFHGGSARVSGVIDGGGGNNGLDYGLYGSAVTINLQAGTAPGTAGFQNIQSMAGSSGGGDTLIGPDAASSWDIFVPNSGSVGSYSFSGFENLTGGAGADAFTVDQGGSFSGQIDGGGGTNTLTFRGISVIINLQTLTASVVAAFTNIQNFDGGTNQSSTLIGLDTASNWDITSNGTGSVGSYTFAGFANVTGGAANDTFILEDGASITGVLDGGGGTNTLSYGQGTGGVYVNLQTHVATGTGGIAHFPIVIGSAQGGDILVGDGQNNILQVLAGNNLVIGGGGADILLGGSGQDLLIAGSTSYDQNSAALSALLAKWADTSLSFSTRVGALLQGVAYTDPMGNTQTATLVAGDTVTQPTGSGPSTLQGGNDLDWFFAGLADTILNRRRGDIVSYL